MVYKEGNKILKISLIFVIVFLFLTAVIYILFTAKNSDDSFSDFATISIPEKSNPINDEMDEYLIDLVEEANKVE